MTVLSALFLYAVAICSHGPIHCSPVSKTRIDDASSNNNADVLCALCQNIHCVGSPQCSSSISVAQRSSFPGTAGRSTIQLQQRSGVINQKQRNNDVDEHCALCQDTHGIGSPRCSSLCVGQRSSSPGTAGRSTIQLQQRSGVINQQQRNNDVDELCALCQDTHGAGSPQCSSLCVGQRSSFSGTAGRSTIQLQQRSGVINQQQRNNDVDELCALCQDTHGIGSPQCSSLCVGQRSSFPGTAGRSTIQVQQRSGEKNQQQRRSGEETNHTARSGANSNQQPLSGANTNHQQRAGANTNQQQRPGANSNQQQRSGANTNQQQRSGANSNQQQRSGANSNQQQRFGANTNQKQRYGANSNQQRRSRTNTNQQQRYGANSNQQHRSRTNTNQQQQRSGTNSNSQQRSVSDRNQQQRSGAYSNQEQRFGANRKQRYGANINQQHRSRTNTNQQSQLSGTY